MYEPAELEMRHFTEQDNEIRNMDIPERMQLRNFPVRFVLPFDKVQLFWQGHKNVRNRPDGFDIYLVNVKTTDYRHPMKA